MKNKKMTNNELLEELRNRGYFILPTGLDNSENVEWIIVSVEEPKKDIYYNWQKDYDKKKRGNGQCN